jgi:hypothetical protein
MSCDVLITLSAQHCAALAQSLAAEEAARRASETDRVLTTLMPSGEGTPPGIRRGCAAAIKRRWAWQGWVIQAKQTVIL